MEHSEEEQAQPSTSGSALVASMNNKVPSQPNSFKEAMSAPDSHLWKIAMHEEYGSLISNGVWELVDLPPERKPVGSKWVFTIKRDSSGAIERYKARLVAKGFTQRYGVDYFETYSPTASLSTIRLLLAAAMQKGYYVDQYDIKTAYLNGRMPEDEVVYMVQPEGFVAPGLEHKVCKIVRSLYGLKQSGRCWYIRFAEAMKSQHMERCKSDACVFVIECDGATGIIIVYVDDLAAIASTQKMRKKLKSILEKEFQVHCLGPISHMLGIHFTRDAEGSLCLDQTNYIRNKILPRFKMEECNAVAMPAIPGSKPPEKEQVDPSYPLRELVGMLSYVANGTRPDITFAVNSLAQKASKPTQDDWNAGKRILRYLKGTADKKLVFKPNASKLEIFADASHADDTFDRRSTSGIVATFGGIPVMWRSNKQQTVSLSSMESEYKALSQATQECLWMRGLLQETKFVDPVETVPIYTDSTAARDHAVNYVERRRTKHIDTIYHFVRDHIDQKDIAISHVPTEMNKADILTKALASPRHGSLTQSLNVLSVSI